MANNETQMLVTCISMSQRRLNSYKSMLINLSKSGLSQAEAIDRLAQTLRRRYYLKLSPESTFSLDPFFKKILAESVSKVNFYEAARQLAILADFC